MGSEQGGPDGADRARAADHPPARWRVALELGGLVVVAAGLPLAVALAVLAEPRWYPTTDLAAIELRVRDIAEGHPPELGMAGRISGFGLHGSHPGPLMFWGLYPFYRLFGATAWALQAAAASLNLLAVALMVWIGHRRGGRLGALAVALGAVVVVHAYGLDKVTSPWNPYFPILWWPVFLLAAWSVLADDHALLPVAAFAGCVCTQTHISYLGLVGAVGTVVGIWLVGTAVRRRRDGRSLRPLAGWAAAALVVVAASWTPPVAEQRADGTGNLSVVVESLRHPQEEPLIDQSDGLRRTVSIALAHLNPGRLLTGTERSITVAPEGPVAPGAVLVALWLAAVVLAARRLRPTHPALLRLHLVAGTALVADVVSIGRIAGATLDYLTLWAWATTMVVVGATAWTAAALVTTPQSAPEPGPTVLEPAGHAGFQAWLTRRTVLAGLLAFLVVGSVVATSDAARTPEPIGASGPPIVSRLAPDTVDALRRGTPPGGGTDGRYLVVWGEDALSLGMSGLGLFLELDRQGFDVGAQGFFATEIGGEHRVLDRSEATALVHLVVGQTAVDRLRATPEAVEVAYHEPRTVAERTEYDRLQAEVSRVFRAEGRSDLLERLDRSVVLAMLAPDLPAGTRSHLDRMFQLGLPAAVFVTPA